MSINLNAVKLIGVNDLGQVYGKSPTTNKNIFVQNAVIGDVVNVRIVKENSKFSSAEIIDFVQESAFRQKSPCRFFEECGGCSFLSYQEEFYQQTKVNILLKTLNQSAILLKQDDIQFFWLGKRTRRKITFQIDENNLLGFFNKGTNKLVNIDDCLLVDKKISLLIPKIQEFLLTIKRNLFGTISITLFDNSTDLILEGARQINESQKNLLVNFAKSNNLNIAVAIGSELILLQKSVRNQLFIGNLQLELDSKIFIQATKGALEIIISQISEFVLQNKKIKKIVDIYSGFGAYSFAISSLVSHLELFEGNQEMVNLIKKNAKNLNLYNKIKATNRDLFQNPINSKDLNSFDLIIINPPRNGALPQIKEIVKSAVKNIVMISCNSITFARDSSLLIESGFKVKNIAAIDQFYSTSNFEIIAIFTK